MATKRTRSTVATGERTISSELKPRDIDAQYYGHEPLFATQPDEDRRSLALVIGFNWYNRFYSTKEAKSFLVDYARMTGQSDVGDRVARVADNEVMPTLGWLARMYSRGLDLMPAESDRLKCELVRLADATAKPVTVVDVVVPQSNRPNIQEIMKDKMRDAAGEFEGILDEYLKCGQKLDINGKVVSILSERNVLPQHISILTDVWQKKIKEFTEVLTTKDKDLLSGYNHYTKTQIKQIIKFCEAIIADLNKYVSVKKASRAPRARKKVPIEKIVKNLKYLKKFEDASMKLVLESISPTKLHGASEAWVYDSNRRKLYHYVADDYNKSFTVKGNTLLGFDTLKSEVKTVRKPTETIKEIMGSKPAARKFFSELKTVATAPNGRFNENMIILRAW